MTGLALRLARLLPIVAFILVPTPAMTDPETPPAADQDVERNAAMAHGLATAPGAGAEGQALLLTMAIQGHAPSQYLLGLMHYEGAGVVRNHVQAVKWLAQAAAQGHPGARADLADFAAGGDTAAHLALGLIDRDSAGDGASAAVHLRAAAAAGDPQGLLALGELYRAGHAVERNPQRAAQLFRAAAEAGMSAALDAARDASAGLLGPGSEGWLELAVARTRAAHAAAPDLDARHLEPFARYWVGLMLLTGAGTASDVPRGLAHHRVAAEAGFALAEFSLGLLTERGHGLPRNLAKARHWFARAAGHGHPIAGGRLKSSAAEEAG